MRYPLIMIILAALTCGCADELGPILDVPNEELLVDTTLSLPERPVGALSGTELIAVLNPLGLREREERILAEILTGNLPNFMRELIPISSVETIGDSTYNITYYVTVDYMLMGSDDDYFLIPMTPILAQELADSLNMSLITRKMVNDIWAAAGLKLAPSPIPPSDEMVTIPVFADHNSIVRTQRMASIESYPLGTLVAGHKKDVILSNRIETNQDKVVIYGWHQLNGQPIQSLYSGHVNWYADYSHGIRLVNSECILNGEKRNISDILSDPELYRLLSDEDGCMTMPRYPVDKSSYPG
ncbi:MAG: hypothetical protein HQ509_11610 [Candidatus Marinimicrobia bacterium]|nr:hypothetical protein [Candidatus Neomarinimicrobiota bacterium]